jgi:tRNA A22 N-methylase
LRDTYIYNIHGRFCKEAGRVYSVVAHNQDKKKKKKKKKKKMLIGENIIDGDLDNDWEYTNAYTQPPSEQIKPNIIASKLHCQRSTCTKETLRLILSV